MQPPFKPGDIVTLAKPKDPADLNRVAIVVDCFLDDGEYMVKFAWQGAIDYSGTYFASRFKPCSNIRRP